MSVVAFPKEVTHPRKVSVLTVTEHADGRLTFALDGKPVSKINMAMWCVSLVETIRDKS